MDTEHSSSAPDIAPEMAAAADEHDEPLSWAWVGVGVLLGAVLIGLFVYLVDPTLENPVPSGAITVLSIILVGILVGYRSPGETIRETAIAGLILLALLAIVVAGILKIALPTLAWLMAPFLVAGVAMLGGWVGEMLQGSLAEAYEDRAVDWPWVFVSVVIGVTLSAYAVFLGRALFDLTTLQSLLVFAASFFVTGWLVGFFSPGMTMIEPAIAAGMLIIIDAGFIILWFDDLAASQTLLVGFGGGMVLALLGGWLGETHQRARDRKRAAR
jgi:MFS family permease